MLYGERKRRAERDQAEAEGHSFWTHDLDERVRNKILYAVRAAISDMYEASYFDAIHQLTITELGLGSLASGKTAQEDVERGIVSADVDIVLSIVDATEIVVSELEDTAFGMDQQHWSSRRSAFEDRIRKILREHRVNFDFVDGQIIPLTSQELHTEVVLPALRLLGSSSQWVSTEKAYQDALAELHGGKPEDAITDAATALQEALGALGCQGNTVSKKLKSALERGLLAPHDSPLVDALSRIGAWIEADRSTFGDAHNADTVELADGWLIVHVVGALLVRLTEGARTN